MAKEDKVPSIMMETYINDDFQKSCDEHDLDMLNISSNSLGSGTVKRIAIRSRILSWM
jgi:hypothetical protein